MTAPPRPGLPPPSDAPPPRAPVAPPWRRARWRWLGPLALGLLGSLVGLLLFTALHPDPARSAPPDVAAAVASALAAVTPTPPPSVTVYRAILPSLVYISTQGNAESADGRGVGSGVIINADGAILTANHVVAGARAISVTFADGTQASATVVNAQPAQDLAVLRTDHEPQVVVPATLGGGVEVGDLTYAVGNPLGLAASLSAGVISGLDRTVPMQGGAGELTGLIQFDAAVNPGSSGGPLLDARGDVVGIVTALANPSHSESFSGIGFAVPLSAAAGGAGGPPR